ncbi:bacterial proteasome activator family protein [Mumia sp. ZJ1417]|uniref:bacterial proteasome activator family protein n=1 Tax=Mumia sp. ZJ1417 TaxID=2708082 RepID=UPI00141DA18B|nr:bacterial proteasome activator family protein [Mumia sp. ZJ1417]QMW66542.1 bacterial proteasome activator family protein [Mumia sp. ZJ1417]
MAGEPFDHTGSEHHQVIGPDGQPVAEPEAEDEAQGRSVTELVEQPAKVMRIGSMIRLLLEEVKSAPLDEASRARLRDIHQTSIKELEDGLAPELVEELERLSLPFNETTPSDDELRIAQAQLVGWLEGLFHGIQTAIYAQQMASQAQLQQMRRALPGAQGVPVQGRPGVPGQVAEDGPQQRPGMYL